MTMKVNEARKLDYGVWWSDEDQCFLARPLTLEAGAGYGETPAAALEDAIKLAELNTDVDGHPVGTFLGERSALEWMPGDIRALRRSLSLSQSEFASLLNVALSTVTHWEQGIRPPSGASSRPLDVVAASPGLVHRWIVARVPA